jgi:hypothetical protein
MPDLGGVVAHDLPDRRLVESRTPELAVFADGAEDAALGDLRRRQPPVNGVGSTPYCCLSPDSSAL